jgi:hypothetical protein
MSQMTARDGLNEVDQALFPARSELLTLHQLRQQETITPKRVQQETTLVHYHGADRELGEGRSATWWTTTDQANIFQSVEDVQRGLALPPECGHRNAVSVAKIPKGTEVEAFSGSAASPPSQSMGVSPGWFKSNKI